MLEVLREQEGPEGQAGRARRVQRHHQGRDARGDEASARDRRRRWSRPISPAARSTISSASICRRCCGASCRARARPAACNRSRCGWSATANSRSRNSSPREYWSLVAHLEDQGRRALHRAPRRRRRQEDQPARHRRRRRGGGLQEGAGSRHVHASLGRGQAGAAQSLPRPSPPRPAAGGLAQARPCAGAHHAARPAPVRRRRHRRRDGRPHHLYAYRRRRHGARGHRQRPQGDRPANIGDDYVPHGAAQISRPRPRTRRKRTRRSARPTSPACPKRMARKCSIPSRPGSTS